MSVVDMPTLSTCFLADDGLLWQGGQHWLVRVEGVDTVQEAEELRGQVLVISAEDRPEIDDDDEFYVQELVGMQVCYISAG